MNGVNFLRELNQNFIQFDVKCPIWISCSAFEAREEKDVVREVVIYDGLGTLGIGLKEEFDRFKECCADHDYRISDNNILYTTSDKSVIEGIVDTVEEYYKTSDYSTAIESLIDVIEPQNKMELK